MDGGGEDGVSVAGDASSNAVYTYAGEGRVPMDATHVVVDSSVTVIPEEAFAGRCILKRVDLPEGLLTISNGAFAGCHELSEVNIPSTVVEIGEEAFISCCKLDGVVLPNGLQRLGAWALWGCGLTKINIPPGLQVIQESTFCHCTALRDVAFSEGLIELGEEAFHSCKSLSYINLPSSLKFIRAGAFESLGGCEGLTTIHLPDGIEAVEQQAFGRCNLRNFRIPPHLAVFDKNIFDIGNAGLVSLELPEDVAQIHESPVYRMGNPLDSLRNIAIPPNCQLVAGGFNNCEDLRKVFPGEGTTELLHALRQRFTQLPIHKICYYHTYHSTESVMVDLKEAINPSTANMPCKLSATGNQPDCLGMTPLHILMCSTNHDDRMVRLLINEYPENIIAEDKWGSLPLVYAFWVGASYDTVKLLVERLTTFYPEHKLDWGGIVETLARGFAPVAYIQNLLNVHKDYFSHQPLDMQDVVLKLANLDSEPDNYRNSRVTPLKTFRFLLQISISRRVDSRLKWGRDIESYAKDFPVAGDEFAYEREKHVMALYAKLAHYELLRETAALLELALWKAKVCETKSNLDEDGRPNKRAKTAQEANCKSMSRINCGANIVIPRVMQYLSWPKLESLIDSDSDSDSDSDASWTDSDLESPDIQLM
ncbi:hypothetical protein ACHAWF_003706 [Thalassiosira exigua]